jgi:Fe2+ or Zn2+ uptake regulation protein
MKIEVPGGTAAVYEPPASPHAHFRCTACGHIADLAFALPAATRAALAERYGVAIEDETVTFSGRCADCTRRGASAV